MRLLEQALAPVEPPASFVDQLESRLADVRGRRARGARGALRLGAGRDARPAQLGAARGGRWRSGTAAGTALVVLGHAPQPPPPAPGLRGLAEQSGKHAERRRLVGARSLIR